MSRQWEAAWGRRWKLTHAEGFHRGYNSGMAKDENGGRPRKRRIREMPARVIARTPWLRKRYARRLVRSIKKMRAKGRKLPDNLLRIERQIRHLPPGRQQQVIEQMLELGANNAAEASRAMRRATERSDRQSGRGKGQRPGTPPGQRRRPA